MSAERNTSDDKLDAIIEGQNRIAGSLEALNMQLAANTINGTYGGAAAGGIMAVAVSMIKNAFST